MKNQWAIVQESNLKYAVKTTDGALALTSKQVYRDQLFATRKSEGLHASPFIDRIRGT